LPPGTPTAPPLDLLAEVEIARTGISSEEPLREIGDLVPLACSECGGPLWKIRDARVDRYRCRVGHAYTAKSLMEEMSVAMERSLWAAIQMMDQQSRMLERFASEEKTKGRDRQAESLLGRSMEAGVHSTHLRKLLFAHVQKDLPKPEEAVPQGAWSIQPNAWAEESTIFFVDAF
jgi:two-component system, chemotaxis family, protein-glutamate methylesterase/glutaminase